MYRAFLINLTHVHAVTIPTIEAAAKGFWIDTDHRWVPSEAEGEFWIPPAQISFVQKRETES